MDTHYAATGLGKFVYAEATKRVVTVGRFHRLDDGGVALDSLTVRGRDREPLTGAVGSVDVDSFTARATARDERQRVAFDALNEEIYGTDVPAGQPLTTRRGTPRKRAPKRPLTDAFLSEVAAVATAGAPYGTRAVAEKWGVNRSTAQSWRQHAKDRGLV